MNKKSSYFKLKLKASVFIIKNCLRLILTFCDIKAILKRIGGDIGCVAKKKNLYQ